MFVRHVAVKSFTGVEVRKDIVYYDTPITIKLWGDKSKELSEYFNIEGRPMQDFSKLDVSDDKLRAVVREMFRESNPNTGDVDVKGDEFYATSIPQALVEGMLKTQQTETGVSLFNGEGTISIAEVLSALGTLLEGKKEPSYDNVSKPTDYFNAGYNQLCWGYASPFFNLYRRDELVKPITRAELAYLIVICSGIFEGIFTKDYEMGLTFDWLRPAKTLGTYKDVSDYKIGLLYTEGAPEYRLSFYKGTSTVTDYINSICEGSRAVPLPVIMSLVELGERGLYNFDDGKLHLMSQVSRGEFCYMITRLANYVKSNKKEAV